MFLATAALGSLSAAALTFLPGQHAIAPPRVGKATPAALGPVAGRPKPKGKAKPKPTGKAGGSKGTGGASGPPPTVIVAVVDGGVDVTHPALAGHLWANPGEANFLTNSADLHDDTGHGTHVSGIIARIDPSAKIMALKAGDGHFIDLGAAAAAIRYAVDHGARIINLSWAFLASDDTLAQAIDYAGAHDVLIVAAAGNFGMNSDLRPTYPGSYQSSTLVSVAATCDGETLASFSNFGKLSVNVAAPGCDISSTLPGGAYGALSGTSMAAPAVAGVAALLLEHRPGTSAQDLARDIEGGSRPSPSLAGALSSGATLDASGALAALANPDRIAPSSFSAASPSASFSTQRDPSYYYQSVTFSWTASNDSDLAGYRVVVDGVAVAGADPSATSLTAKIAPGSHTWSVVAYDRSGNATTASS